MCIKIYTKLKNTIIILTTTLGNQRCRNSNLIKDESKIKESARDFFVY